MPKLKVVVLAAGLSSRLGRPKALVRIHGISLLRRTLLLAAALPAAGIVAVVPPASVRYRRESARLRVSWVPNAQRATGLSSSVRCGLKACKFASGALLLPVDLCGLNASDLRALVSRWRSAPGRVYATRVLNAGTAHAGTPLILPARYFALAFSLKGDVGLRALIGALPATERILVDMPSALADVDTAQDLALARRRWR